MQGQDPHALPYDPESTIAEQVHTSIRSSLRNLRPLSDESSSGSTFLDCLVFHSPLPTIADTLVAWRTAESYVPHKIRHLGISNVHLPTLEQLFSTAKIKPAVVQNRFHPGTQFDTQVRAFCVGESIVYQSFWTLSANPEILKSSEVSALADQAGLTAYEAMYCFVLACNNVVILNGTTNEKHMLGDLAAVQKTRDFASLYPVLWKKQLNKFKILIKDPDTVRQTERP